MTVQDKSSKTNNSTICEIEVFVKEGVYQRKLFSENFAFSLTVLSAQEIGASKIQKEMSEEAIKALFRFNNLIDSFSYNS